MPYANAHLLIRFGGHFGASADKQDFWTTSVRLAVVGDDVVYDAAKLQTLVNSLSAHAATYHTSSAAKAGNGCFFTTTTGARVGIDGKYDPIDQETTVHEEVAPVSGSGTATLPWSTANVISLRTSRPRGRASNGRMYWPACSQTVTNTTGRISSSDMGFRASAIKAFLQGINTAAAAYQVNTRLAVCSNRGLGLTALVNGFRTDDRLDSIERRENNRTSIWVEDVV